MYKAKTGKNSFNISLNDNDIFVNGEPFSWDPIEVSQKYFHILRNNKSYRAVVVDVDKMNKKVTVEINNKICEIALQDKFDLQLEKMGMNSGTAGRINFVKAPMPGLIVELKVKEGDEVRSNAPLIVLEAMKMENIIKSPGDGVVKSIRVKKGDSVEKNQILIEF